MPHRGWLLIGALAVACARAGAPVVVSDDAPRAANAEPRAALARLEARREAGSAELVGLTQGPPTPTSLAAIRGLGRVGDAAALARLEELLGAPEPALRIAAARATDVAGALDSEVSRFEATPWQRWSEAAVAERVAIVESARRAGGAATVARLAAALGPGEALEVREAAAIVLGIFGRRQIALDEAARAGLVALAQTGEPRLVYAAAYGLAHEHQPAGAAGEAALVQASAAADPDTRALGLKGLARRKAPAALEALRAGLGDRDPWVQVAAVRGLGELGDPAAIAALWGWLVVAVESDVADGAGPGHPVLEGMSVMTARKEAPAGAAEAHARAERRLATAAPPAVRVQARIACGLASLAARRPEWRAPLRCAEPVGEAAAIERVNFETGLIGQGWGGPGEARVARLRALAGDPDARVRAAALAAAASLWDEAPVAVEAMLVAGLRDSSRAAAGTAAEAIAARWAGRPGAAGGDGSTAPSRPAASEAIVTALLERAAGDRDGELFAGLASALAEVGGPRGLAICRAALADANPTVRAAARACVKTASGADPGPTSPGAPAPSPPHDPASVLGREVLWRLHTERGRVDIVLDPATAPWHVAAIVALTRGGFYDGLSFHRVVPGYVVQGGDPDGTGWGGPGFNLPSEPGEKTFARGAVGIADAGKDTGGSQFFVMHARAPHLDGRYTRVGEVRDGLAAALALVVGDRIVAAEVTMSPQAPGR